MSIYHRYHVRTQQAPRRAWEGGPAKLRAEPVGSVARVRVARSSSCINCGRCTIACVYGVHERRPDDYRQMSEPHSLFCRDCFRCVQECPRGALTILASDTLQELGAGGWAPEMVALIWQEAEAGKIPVSGAGYRGRFAGPGFDAMWTDMSEIVRPTRDGIHGREHISTSVDLGRKPAFLRFDAKGNVTGPRPRIHSLPIPIMIETTDLAPGRDRLIVTAATAARDAQTYFWVKGQDLATVPPDLHASCVVRVESEADLGPATEAGAGIVEIGTAPSDPTGLESTLARLRRNRPTLLVAASIAADETSPREAERLARAGVDILVLRFDESLHVVGSGDPDGTRDRIRAVHRRLVQAGVRDETTLLVAGAIGAAEHVPKAIICGADAVIVGMPVWIAQGCSVCAACPAPGGCPARFESIDTAWGAQRIVNLLGSWRDQLLEILGAMGMREVRRLRGETGRAIFQSEMESSTFARMFQPGNTVAAAPASAVLGDPNTAAVAGASQGWLAQALGTGEGPGAARGAVVTPDDEMGRDGGPAIVETPALYAEVSRWLVDRGPDCISCGMCVQVCPYGVHEFRDGYLKVSEPISSRCIGPECESNAFYCVAHCPKQALSVQPNPAWRNLGDRRWTADLIAANWEMARSGRPAVPGARAATAQIEYGDSGGGFDRMRLKPLARIESLHSCSNADRPGMAAGPSAVDAAGATMAPAAPTTATTTAAARTCADGSPARTSVSTALALNRRGEGPQITIPIPIYGGGMSYGSIGVGIMVGRAMAAKAWGTFISTGEGGYPDELIPYADHVITQVATGLFGVREETIQRTRIVEFKYAQGAKPGLGGHLLADKNTPDVARMREAPEQTSLFSPFPFHSVYSVEDHKKHVDWIRAVNPRALISVKVSTPTDVDMVAVGSYYAGAHILQVDGGYGGTGAAPDIAKKNIALPIEYAIPKVHEFLLAEGIRDQITLMVSGGVRTARDIAKAIAMGADGVVVGTAELVAVGCVRCGACESHRGCPRGIATTDRELTTLIEAEWAAQRITNLYAAWKSELEEILRAAGLSSVRDLRGRYDLIEHMDYLQ